MIKSEYEGTYINITVKGEYKFEELLALLLHLKEDRPKLYTALMIAMKTSEEWAYD